MSAKIDTFLYNQRFGNKKRRPSMLPAGGAPGRLIARKDIKNIISVKPLN